MNKLRSSERRKFSRVLFDAHVELAQGNHHWRANLLDISLKGLLLQQNQLNGLDPQQAILAKVILTDSTCIAMSATVAHQHGQQLGLACQSIDIDSISHLRRLIEFNLGDPQAAERELTDLISDL